MKRLRKWTFTGISAAIIVALGFLTVGFLAPLEIHYVVDHDAAPTAPYGPDLGDRPFVGLALSGGGARAALFGAAGIEALARRGLLADVTHVSSVSGGGFAAAYMALNPVPDCAPVASDTGAPDDCLGAYFTAMQETVSGDYLRAVTLVQLRAPWRILQPSRRLTSLREALDAEFFLNGARFADIVDDRAYLFNTVSYDTGQRFVFGNLGLPHPDSDGASALPSSLRALSFSQPGQPQPTPGRFPLSLAVATSAAFPPYLGPLTIELGAGDGMPVRYRHLGDGGVLENTGVETLTEAFLARAAPGSARIYSFNAGLPLNREWSETTRDISIFSRDLPQIVDVLLTYARTHRVAHIAEFAAARDLDIEVISFDYLDVARIVAGTGHGVPEWQSWDGWDNCPTGSRGNADSPAARLRGIPTNLRITSCDADLITEAAEFLVESCLGARAANGCFVGR